MIAKKYLCDDYGTVGEFTSYIKARAAHWAVSRDYSKCYCPECAPAHRLGGANGKRTPRRHTLPTGFEQLKFEIN